MTTELEILKQIFLNNGKASVPFVAQQVKVGDSYARYLCEELLKKDLVKRSEKRNYYKITLRGRKKFEKPEKPIIKHAFKEETTKKKAANEKKPQKKVAQEKKVKQRTPSEEEIKIKHSTEPEPSKLPEPPKLKEKEATPIDKTNKAHSQRKIFEGITKIFKKYLVSRRGKIL